MTATQYEVLGELEDEFEEEAMELEPFFSRRGSLEFESWQFEKSLSPQLRSFLKQVRARPQDHKKLLLTVTFHPHPDVADVAIPQSPTRSLIEFYALYSSVGEVGPLLDELRRIRDAFQKVDKNFKQQIEADLQLRNDLFKATGLLVQKALLRTAGTSVSTKLKSFLLDSLLKRDAWAAQEALGYSFAQQMLPPRLAQRIIESEARDSHWSTLVGLLIRYAERLQERDPAFRRLVEQERLKLVAPKKKKRP